MKRTMIFLAGSAALALLSFTAWAHGTHGEAGTNVEPVLSTELLETDGKHVTAVVVTVEPGAHFDPHRHPGTVLVYVLEGEIESALDEEDPITFTAGQAWSEPVGVLHRVTKNSSDERARLLAVLVHDKDASLQLPAE